MDILVSNSDCWWVPLRIFRNQCPRPPECEVKYHRCSNTNDLVAAKAVFQQFEPRVLKTRLSGCKQWLST